MFCPNCGKQLPDGAKFCPDCGTSRAPAQAAPRPSAPAKSAPAFKLDSKTLLCIAAGVTVVLLAVLLFRPKAADTPPQDPAQEEQADPAAALVGSWATGDGVGVKFTKDGSFKITAGSLSLGADKFTYEVEDDSTLTLTPEVSLFGMGGVGLELTATYAVEGDTLYLEVGDYILTLTRK